MELTDKEFIDSLISLVDGVTELVEIYKPEGVHNQLWKEAWLTRARNCLVHYDVHKKVS